MSIDKKIENSPLDMPDKKEKNLIIGSVPKLNEYFMHLAWGFVRDEVDKLQKEAGGHEALSDIWQDIFFGRSFLYLGFVVEGKVEEKDFQEKLLECLTQKGKNEFAGFFVLKMEEHNFHLWQAYIADDFKGSDVFSKAYDYLEKQVKKLGTPTMTFATHRDEWSVVAKRLGFKKISTLYKKELL